MTIAKNRIASAADVLATFMPITGGTFTGPVTLSSQFTINLTGELYIGDSDFRRATFWPEGVNNQVAQLSRIGSTGTDAAILNSFYLINHTGGASNNVFNVQVQSSASGAPAGGAWNLHASFSTTSAYANKTAAGNATQVASYAQAVRTAVTGGAVGVALEGLVVEMNDKVDLPSSQRGSGVTLELDWAGNNVDDDDSTGVASIDLSLANNGGSDLLLGNIFGVYGNTHTKVKRYFMGNVAFTQAFIDARLAAEGSGANTVWMADGQHIAFSTDGKWTMRYDSGSSQLDFLYNGGVLGFWDLFSTLHASGGFTTTGTVAAGTVTATGAVTATGVVSGSYVQGTGAVGISGAGTTQGTATVLATQWNQIGTTASGTGVLLPSVSAGTEVGVWNNGANALLVYPPSSQSIDALSNNVAFSVPAGTSKRFVHIGSAKWFSS
jgi:hypothetical protein